MIFYLAFWYRERLKLYQEVQKIKDIDDDLSYVFTRQIPLISFVGFLFAFFIEFNDTKWEFSRFLIPAYSLGSITFLVSLLYLKEALIGKFRFYLNISIILSLFWMFFGTIVLIIIFCTRYYDNIATLGYKLRHLFLVY